MVGVMAESGVADWGEVGRIGVDNGRSPSTVSVTTICEVGVGLAIDMHAEMLTAKAITPNHTK